MRFVDLIHRWTGGLVGLLLAVIGLSGALLVHKNAWVTVAHADDPLVRETAGISETVAGLMADPARRPDQISFASSEFGLHQLHYPDGAGAYADQAGGIVTQWASQWSRPELWLFDLHHHLFAGKPGELVTGLLGLIGLGFIVTGTILWWRLRKSFSFRLWPARMSRPAILRHHRNLAVLLSPLLLLSFLTGAMMDLKPVQDLVLSPWTAPAQMNAALASPEVKGGALSPRADWGAMLAEARRQFPAADFRILTLPRAPGDLIMLRLKQPGEWLPNGRTAIWFAPEDGKVVAVRDGLSLPSGVHVYGVMYTLHAARLDGLPYRLLMTLSGLGLTMLGTLAVWSFWFRRKVKGKPARPRAAAT